MRQRGYSGAGGGQKRAPDQIRKTREDFPEEVTLEAWRMSRSYPERVSNLKLNAGLIGSGKSPVITSYKNAKWEESVWRLGKKWGERSRLTPQASAHGLRQQTLPTDAGPRRLPPPRPSQVSFLG